jgi:hypothetical protein
VNRDWVKTLTISLPGYAEDLGNKIQSVMTEHNLGDAVAHSCALAAALADGNGELAFEITMSDVLFGNDIREDIAKTVAAMSVDIVNMTYDVCLLGTPYVPSYDTPYALASALVLGNSHIAQQTINNLLLNGFPSDQIKSVADIASVIPAISKCLI